MSGRVKVNVSFKALCWQVFSSASLPKLMAGGRDGVSAVGLLSLFLGWGIEKGVEQRMQKIWSLITLSIFPPPHVVKLKSRPKLDRSPSVRPTLIRSLIAQFYQGLINTQWVRANPMCTRSFRPFSPLCFRGQFTHNKFLCIVHIQNSTLIFKHKLCLLQLNLHHFWHRECM